MSAAGTLLETFITLGLVCIVAFVVLYFARRAGIARAYGAAEMVGFLPLEPRRSLYLVRVGGRVLVIGASEAGLAKLGELEAADVPVTAGPRGFGDVLARALARRSPAANDAPAAKDGGAS